MKAKKKVKAINKVKKIKTITPEESVKEFYQKHRSLMTKLAYE